MLHYTVTSHDPICLPLIQQFLTPQQVAKWIWNLGQGELGAEMSQFSFWLYLQFLTVSVFIENHLLTDNYLGRDVRKPPSDMWAKRRLGLACAFAQSDQNLHLVYFGWPWVESFIMWTAKIPITVRMRRLICLCWARISGVCFSRRGSLGNVSGLGPDWFLVVNASPVTSVPCQTRDITWSPSRIWHVFANSRDPDHLASEESNWSGSALFVIQYVNLY